MSDGIKVVTRNRKAQHDYHLLDKYEAGLVLMGSEVKSIRDGRINIRDGFVREVDGEFWLMNVHIAPYDQANIFGHSDPLRPRKLLLHKKEIRRIGEKIRERGYTVVPTSIYLKGGWAKAEIALAKGKREYDKRQTLSKRDADRQISRALKERG